MPDHLNSAGFIVYRVIEDDQPEFLLLQSSRGRRHWHFPKGRREPGETVWDNAVRELQEVKERFFEGIFL